MAPLSIAQNRDLGIFFSKLLAEVRHLDANKAMFQPTGDALSVKLFRENTEVRTLNIQLSWFDLVWSWLSERVSYFDLSRRPLKLQIPKKLKPQQHLQQIAIRVASELMTFSAALESQLKGSKAITLQEFRGAPLTEIHDLFGIPRSPENAAPEKSFLRSDLGILLFSSPKAEQLPFATSTFMGLLTAPLKFSDWTHQQEANQALYVLATAADDPYHCLMNARPHLENLQDEKCIGLVGLGFAKQVCQGCAKETPMDQKLIDPLPEVLKSSLPSTYLVGRGCDLCGHTGFDGLVPLQSIVELDHGLAQAFKDSTTMQYISMRGYKPLLVDGLEKLKLGRTTLQSIYEITKSIPEAALESLQSIKSQKMLRPESKSSKAASKGRRRPLVMVVEDDLDQCAILEMVFKSANYDLLFAHDGLEALGLLKNETPDLVVTDLMMPHMDGRELVARMKIDQRLREVPVLILTVISDSEKEYDLLDLGADDYCEKTVQRKVLLKRVENILKRHA